VFYVTTSLVDKLNYHQGKHREPESRPLGVKKSTHYKRITHLLRQLSTSIPPDETERRPELAQGLEIN